MTYKVSSGTLTLWSLSLSEIRQSGGRDRQNVRLTTSTHAVLHTCAAARPELGQHITINVLICSDSDVTQQVPVGGSVDPQGLTEVTFLATLHLDGLLNQVSAR